MKRDVGFGCGCSPSTTTCSVTTCINNKTIDLTVGVWDDPGCETDNVVRVYNKGDCVYHEGYLYWPKEDMTISKPPSADWSEPKTICETLKPVEKCGGGLVDGEVVQCDQMGRGLWFNPVSKQWESISSSIPTGCQEFVASVTGSFAVNLETDTPFEVTNPGEVNEVAFYQMHPPGVLTYSVADYPYLAVAGRKICVKIDSNIGYALVDPNDRLGGGSQPQTGLWVKMNGEDLKRGGDGYFMNGDGQDHESGTSNCICFETTGEDISLEVFRYIRWHYENPDGSGTRVNPTGVLVFSDTADIAAVFSDGTAITA